MDIGVWMTRDVLEHKQDTASGHTQVWNVGMLPDECSRGAAPMRLFVAISGYWRGYFVLEPNVLCDLSDHRRPYTLIFDPTSWTEITPVRAVNRDRSAGYTLDVPTVS